MDSDRRVSIRYPFSATVEVMHTETSQTQRVILGDLSHCGCFLTTAAPFPRRTRVWLQIDYAGDHFSAFGRVAYTLAEGMGVVFSTIEPKDEEILDRWLEQKIE